MQMVEKVEAVRHEPYEEYLAVLEHHLE